MNSIDFCFWLQGYFEISGSKEISPAQTEVVKAHLALVFVHEIDPLREKQTPATTEQLDNAHMGNAHLRPRPDGNNDPLMRC